MVTYADSSFLVSLYVNDDHGKIANNYLAKNPSSLMVTLFSKAEAQHALRLLVFRRDISESIMTRHLLTFERDQEEGFLEMAQLDLKNLLLTSSQLSRCHALELGVRYLDLLHVSSALLLNAKRFLTFDLRQRNFALRLGLDVKI